MELVGKSLWVWEFSTDGSVSQIIERAKKANAGVIVKVLQGVHFMSDFDRHPDSIDSPRKAQAIRDRFEQAGVPCSFWSVPTGETDIQFEAKATLEVINQARPRTWYLDVEPYQSFWQGTPDAASTLVRAIQGYSAAADAYHRPLTVVAAPDGRPWAMNDSITAFCQQADAVAPQCYWRTFADNGKMYQAYGYDPFANGGPGVTPNFTITAALKFFDRFKKPILPVFQGDSSADELRQAIDVVEYLKLLGYSVWRLGVVPDAELTVMAPFAPPGAADAGAAPVNPELALVKLADALRIDAVKAAVDLDPVRMQNVINFLKNGGK